ISGLTGSKFGWAWNTSENGALSDNKREFGRSKADRQAVLDCLISAENLASGQISGSSFNLLNVISLLLGWRKRCSISVLCVASGLLLCRAVYLSRFVLTSRDVRPGAHVFYDVIRDHYVGVDDPTFAAVQRWAKEPPRNAEEA